MPKTTATTRGLMSAADFLPLVQRVLKQRRVAWTA